MPLEEGLPEHLPCGHVFHAHCLDEFAATTDTPRALLRCPHCRMTPSELNTAAQRLMTSPMSLDDAQVISDSPTQGVEGDVSGAPTHGTTAAEGNVSGAPTHGEVNASGSPTQTSAETPVKHHPDSQETMPLVEGTVLESSVDYHAVIPPHLSHLVHPSQIAQTTAGSSSSAPPDPSASSIVPVVATEPESAIETGKCFFCDVVVSPGDGKILARYPIQKLQCKNCKRVDQAIGRSFGSVNWIREFYNRAHKLPPKAIAEMCQHTIAWKD